MVAEKEGVGVYAVADGVGEHPRSEVAAGIIGHVFKEAVEQGRFHQKMGTRAVRRVIRNLIRGSIEVMDEVARQEKEFERISATFALAVLVNGRIYIAHIGDARVYLQLKDGALIQVTQDQFYSKKTKEGLLIPRQIAQGRSAPKGGRPWNRR